MGEPIDPLNCYTFSISNHLTQMANFPTWIPDCDSYSPALLDSFHSSDASICSIMTFTPLGNSDHAVVSVSVDFPINSKWEALFHCIAYNYFFDDWDGLRVIWEMLCGRISLNSVLLLLLVNFASRNRLELMYIFLIVTIRSNFTHCTGFQQLMLLP